MADNRDGSQSPYDIGTPRGVNNSGPMNASIVGGRLPSVTPTSTGQAAITSVNAPPGISPDVFQQVQESLRRVIKDAARQGNNITTTVNLTSPYQLSTPMVAQDPKGHSEIMGVTPGVPRKTGKDRADYLGKGEHSQKGDEGISGRGRQDRYQTDSELEETRRDVEALERRQRPQDLLDHDSESPFVNNILQTQFPERFRMPQESDGNRRNSRSDKKFHGQYTNYTPLTNKQEEILVIIEDQKLVKYPPRQSTYARRDTTKYCRFHKEIGHDISKSYQLKDHIETLMREGHLKDLILKRTDDQQKDLFWDNQPMGNQEKK
ncbi:hypothetical protein Dsin_016442 [Dipteronia sinensis]|uniref:Uncharacterized protein n=1 Tax=Dipteronia sinensis TaxID=43782 RepID=A0AAE0AD41_9ROSI|nr:hypothetical protein Dsin_016442 [Dipteronia sinensis]